MKSFRHGTNPTPYPESDPPNFLNGSALQIGMVLGEIKNEGQRQTEIMLSMLDAQQSLPEKLAERLRLERIAGVREGSFSTALAWLERLRFLGPAIYLIIAMMTALGLYVPGWLREFSEHLKGD